MESLGAQLLLDDILKSGVATPPEKMSEIQRKALLLAGIAPVGTIVTAMIPMDRFKEYVTKMDFFNYGSFDEYHQEYMANTEGMEKYPDLYPCVCVNEWDGIEDGWHRFNAYVARNEPFVPVIYY